MKLHLINILGFIEEQECLQVAHNLTLLTQVQTKRKNTINLSAFVKENVDFICTSCSSGQTHFSCTTTTKHCVLINAEHRETRHPDKILLAISNINDNVPGGM